MASCASIFTKCLSSSTETGEGRLTAADMCTGDMDPLKALCFLSEGEQNGQFKRRCIACAVNVNKVKEEYLLLTSSSAIKDEDKEENLVIKRFSRRHFGRYTVKVLSRKEFGEFTFLKIEDTPQANGGKWSIDPLDLKLPSSENLKALTSPCATEKFKFKFKCDVESGTIELMNKKHIEETSIVGAPIIIKESGQFSVIGVVGLTSEKQLCPYYLNANILGEFFLVCAHLHLVGLIFSKWKILSVDYASVAEAANMILENLSFNAAQIHDSEALHFKFFFMFFKV